MRWPIKNQILVPLVGIVFLSVIAVTAGGAVLAARRSEQQTIEHLRKVVSALGNTRIPFTEPILVKMRELTGAHFIAFSEGGKPVASTLPWTSLLPELHEARGANVSLDSFSTQPVLTLGETRFFASSLPTPGNALVRSLLVLYPEQDLSRIRREAAVFPLAVGGITILLTTFVALVVAHRFSGRIRSLQKQVAAIAAGDFTKIPSGTRSDEVQDLVHDINVMCEQLHHMQSVLRESERARLLAQFAGGLAHQLRNAITGARLALQLHQRRRPATAGDETISVALGQLSLTETHLKGLLSLGRNEHRVATPTDISRVIADVSALVDPVCQHAQVQFDTLEVAEELWVLADNDSLRAGLMNVVLNAIEAAGAGGSVTLGAHRRGAEVLIDVCDTGPGPPAGLEVAMFEPFVTSKSEGVGFGLSIARQIAVDVKGTLSWSRHDNLTCFRFALPLCQIAQDQPQANATNASASQVPSSADACAARN